ncbi:hypothetical protein P3T16_006577 [Paraburkholderia sp. GAS42]
MTTTAETSLRTTGQTLVTGRRMEMVTGLLCTTHRGGGQAAPFLMTIGTRASGFRRSTAIVITSSTTGTGMDCKRRRAGISG